VEVKVRRQELNFTQEDLAGRCDLDRPYISLIEVGKKQPTISVLYRIATALELPFGDFCSRIETRHLKHVKQEARAKKKALPNSAS
jgi:transcriptional regulator with XRE-family HTH domain